MTIAARKKKGSNLSSQPILEEPPITERDKDTERKRDDHKGGGNQKGDASPSRKQGSPSTKPQNRKLFPTLSAAFHAQDEEEKEVEKFHFHLDYSIENIKSRYLFPFNQTAEKSNLRN